MCFQKRNSRISSKPLYTRWWFWIIILLIIIFIWAFVCGPLFAWGPKWGYAEEKHDQAILLARNPALFDTISDINQIFREEESFHGLSYKSKVLIVFVDNKYEWKSIFPYLSSGVGGASLQTGNAIFINYPKIARHNYSMDGFIKHELSHTLLYQNSGLIKAYQMFKHFWPEEGIATYFGGPFDYFANKEEYLAAFKGANLEISNDPLKLYDGISESGGKISYTTYRYFFEYLDTTYGREKLQQFIKAYNNNPNNFQQDFHNIFGISILDAVKSFDKNVINR